MFELWILPVWNLIISEDSLPGVGTVVRQDKPALRTLPSHIRVPGLGLGYPELLIQLPARVPEKQQMTPNYLGSFTHMGDQGKVLGFWLQPGLAPAV